MSNIHQNDELLRVQDQNYDIVFNYDKHENGGVAVHAEKDGKNHKVNPEYARAALVKQIGSGGGWPADLPKPSVGGYGYTENGEQTVITWNGDIEGRDAFVLHSTYGDVNCYKVAEKEDEYPEAASVELTIVGGESMKLDVELNEYTGAYAYNTQGQPVVIIASAGDINVRGFTGTAPSDGVYSIVQNGFYASSLTYGTPDTTHKINEKYLPEGGFGYTEQGEQTVITWDGDTTGKVVVDVGGGLQFVKVADVPVNFDPNSVTNIADTTGEQAFEVHDAADESGVIGYQTTSNASLNVIVDFVKATEMGIEFTENGIYFQKGGFLGSGYITSLTYGTPDTVHKIDEKYLPASGGSNDFIIEMPSTTGALTESTIAQLDAIKEFVAGNMDKKEPYTIKCYVPHPSGNTAIIDCSVKYRFDSYVNKPVVRITGSQLANMTYTQYGLEFYCIDFHQEGTWTQTSTPPWQYVLQTVALQTGD